MRSYQALSLRVSDQRVQILDQTRLPDDEVWLDGSHPETMFQHIQALRVRGAPLIGIAAALSLAWLADQRTEVPVLKDAARHLRSARPTAVNLMHAMDRVVEALDQGGPDALIAAADALFEEDVALCAAIAQRGADLICDGETILTHCNTGGLATAGVGTALGAIREAWRRGRRPCVFVDETRPLLQGARLTTWELARLGIPHTLITDSMAGALMREGEVDRVMVGADRVARNGDFANKVGTYGLAVLAHHHDVPFHALAPRSTVDLACRTGAAIQIEERSAREVRGYGTVRWAPASASVWNPAFDVTPATLVTSLVLDSGVLPRADLLQDGLPRHLAQASSGNT